MSERDADEFAPDLIRELLFYLGENPDREGLHDTPRRALKAFQHFTSGYKQDPKAILKSFEDGAENFDEMVVQLGVPFWSSCEHHLLPFWGVAHVGYIPSSRILGLSKISRLIEVFARRLTVQERLTVSIAQALMDGLDARGVGVVLQARHSCMESRGIQKAGTITVTTVMRGVFRDKPETRAEFLALVNHAVGGQTL